MDWTKILWAVLIVMMIASLWPAYKHHMKHGKKAEKGDWEGALLPLGAVVVLVVLLIMSVR